MTIVLAITDANFAERVLAAKEPVLVKFTAEWCAPCKTVAPLLSEVANTYAGRMLVAELDVDANPQTTQRLGVRGLPTLMLFKHGQVAAQKVGAPRRTELLSFIADNV